MTVAAWVVLALLLPIILFDLVATPSVRRVGLRNVVRRRGEAALVIAGSMLATALITASMVVGDSFGASIRHLAQDGWGPIDEVAHVDDSADLATTAERLRRNLDAVDGVLALQRVELAASGFGVDAPAEPVVHVFAVDGPALANFGGDPQATGFASVTAPLAPGEIVVNETLAEQLALNVGDQMKLFGAGQPAVHTVVEVVASQGMASVLEAVVATGGLDRLTNDDSAVRNTIVVSNVGDVYRGADRTAAVVLQMRELLGPDVEVEGVKADLLADADEEAAENKSLFGTIGGFSVAAGVLLVINLFVMLASERKTELGLMRAVGTRRGHILRAFLLEGAVYGIVAAALGALAGIGVGAAVIRFVSVLFEGEGGPDLTLAVVPGSILAGAAIGFAISQLTVTLTSVRISKLNIVAALKDQAEPANPRRGRWALVFGLAGVVLSGVLMAAFSTTPFVAMLAPVLAAGSAMPVLGRFLPARGVTALLSIFGVIWPAAVMGLMADTMSDPDISIFLLQGILMVAMATILVSALRPLWMAVAAKLTGNGVATRIGLAHPLARPVRTALLVAMYSLVIFTVSFMSVMTAVFSASTPTMAFQAGGGYDLVVDANPASGFTTEELLARDDVERAVPIRRHFVEMAVADPEGRDSVVQGVRVSFVPPEFDEVPMPELTERAGAFATDAEAWAAVTDGALVNGESERVWVLVPNWLEVSVGDDTMLMLDGGGEAPARVAGLTDLQWLVGAGMLAPVSIADELGADRPLERHYVTVAEGFDPDAVVDDIEAAEVERGVDATTFLAEGRAEVQGQESFVKVLQGYLGLGLLIGIAGLGVVLARAVRERRKQIGMMRAVGFPGSVVRRAFMVEALFVGAQGVVLGIGLGVLSAWQTLTRSSAFEENLTFALPAGFLVILGIGCLAASLTAALIPAIRSGRITPAVALRH